MKNLKLIYGRDDRMKIFVAGLIIGLALGVLIGYLWAALFYSEEEIDRLRREQREARISAAGRKTDS